MTERSIHLVCAASVQRHRARDAVSMIRAWQRGECPEWAPGDRERAIAVYRERLRRARRIHSGLMSSLRQAG
jgi:hypothetical protein